LGGMVIVIVSKYYGKDSDICDVKKIRIAMAPSSSSMVFVGWFGSSLIYGNLT
jgi:hypothetical protein